MEKTCNLLFCAVGIVTVFFIIVYSYQNPVYWFIDDIRMREFVSGDLTGVADGHCVYLQYIWGMFLAFLYRIFPKYSWYDITMIGIMWISLVVILFRAICICKVGIHRVWVSFAFCIFCVLFIAKNLLYVQFTMVSAIAFIAAYFWYITQRENRTPKESIVDVLVCLFFLFLSIMIRKNTFYMLIVFAGSTFIGRILKSKKERKWNGILACCLLCMLLVINGVYSFSYGNEAYTSYRKYNIARSLVFDYYGLPDFNTNFEIYKKLGIEADLYEGLVEYSLALEKDDVTAETLEQIADYQQLNVNGSAKSIWERIKIGIKSIITYNGYTRTISIFGISVLLVGIILCLWNDRTPKMLRYFYIGGVAVAECLYFSYRDRLLEHLVSPILLVIMTTILGDIFFERMEKRGKTKSEVVMLVYLGVLGCMLLVPCFRGIQEMAVEMKEHLNEAAYAMKIIDSNPENFYYVDAWIYYGNPALSVLNKDISKRNYIYDGGWGTNHPLYQEVLTQNQLIQMKNDLLLDNVYFISPRSKYYIIRYYLSKGISVKIETIDNKDIGNKYCYVYKVKQADNVYHLDVENGSILCSDLSDEITVLAIKIKSPESISNPYFKYSIVYPNHEYEDVFNIKLGNYHILFLNISNWKNIEKFSFEISNGVNILDVSAW